MAGLPEWLRPGARPTGRPLGAAVGDRVVRRALGAIGRALALLVVETEPSRGGPLRDADPRAKMLAAVGLIVVATLLREPASLAACLALPLATAVAAHVPARRLVPVAIVAIASAAFMLPATLNVVSGGHPVLTLWRPAPGNLGPWRLPAAVAVTGSGIVVAGRMVLRATACAALAVLLTTATPPQELFAGLRSFGVPQAFVMVLSMTERYLAVLLQSARELHLARLARSVAAIGVRREEAWAAAGVGAVFRRTRVLADDVALAMASRGFCGEVRLLRPARWRVGDWIVVAASAAAGAALLALDRGLA
ncbi:MAG TPA: energy-coupling factor transporter transmembrane component T [Thermoanaerobaculaceae bacterium]|nr:energy-coupling factor transporter transmembrane component T [Thermoanaerobaculaceae bacterium]